MSVSRTLQIGAVGVVAVLAVGLAGVAMVKSHVGAGVAASPAPVPSIDWPSTQPSSAAASTSPSAQTTPTTTPTPSPSPSASPSAPLTGMAGVRALLNGSRPVSILVLGDGSGDANGEWVSVWAQTYLAKTATVRYSAWNTATGAYDPATTYGSGQPTVTIWNASHASPVMSNEASRVATVWHQADLVIYSYGHRKSAAQVTPALDAIDAAVQHQNAQALSLVMIQNPDPVATEAQQKTTTAAVASWANANYLPTVDIYDAFVNDPRSRSQLVQADGTPTPAGSALWAQTLNSALG